MWADGGNAQINDATAIIVGRLGKSGFERAEQKQGEEQSFHISLIG
jgi:hypothetical protein